MVKQSNTPKVSKDKIKSDLDSLFKTKSSKPILKKKSATVTAKKAVVEPKTIKSVAKTVPTKAKVSKTADA